MNMCLEEFSQTIFISERLKRFKRLPVLRSKLSIKLFKSIIATFVQICLLVRAIHQQQIYTNNLYQKSENFRGQSEKINMQKILTREC